MRFWHNARSGRHATNRRTPLDETRAVAGSYNTQHTKETDIRTPGGIRNSIRRNERPHTHASILAATWIGDLKIRHCLIQQANVLAKSFKMNDVTPVSKTRQFHSLKIYYNHNKFKYVLRDTVHDKGYILYNALFRWLRCLHKVSVGKPEGKRPLGRPRRR